jgi:hypothetical protein
LRFIVSAIAILRICVKERLRHASAVRQLKQNSRPPLQPNARPSAPHARQRAQQEAGHGEMDLVKTALRLTQIHHRNGVWRGGVALLAKIFYFFGGIF